MPLLVIDIPKRFTAIITEKIIIAGKMARFSFFFMELVGFSDKFDLPFQRGKRGIFDRYYFLKK